MRLLPGIITLFLHLNFFWLNHVKAQFINPELSQLMDNLAEARESGSKARTAEALLSLADSAYYKYDSMQLAEHFYEEATQYFNAESEAFAHIVSNLSYVYNELGDYRKALAYADSAMPWFEQNERWQQFYKLYSRKGLTYANLNKNDSSLNSFLTALRGYERIGSHEQVMIALNNIGLVLSRVEDTVSAYRYLLQAYELATKYTDTLAMAISANNLSVYYHTKNLDSSEFFNEVALSVGPGLDYGRAYYNSLVGAARIAEERGDYDKVFEFCDLVIGAEDLPTHLRLETSCELYRAMASRKKNKLKDALKYGSIALRKANLTGNQQHIFASHEELYKGYKAFGDMGLALDHYERFTQLKDSLLNVQNIARVKELAIKYETEKKEQQLIELSQRNQIQALLVNNQRIIIISAVVVFILLFSVLYFYYGRRVGREREKVTRIQQKLLRSQMNPHFIFNALSSIRGYLFEERDIKSAVDYLSKFSKLMRLVLDHTSKEWITLEEEIEALKLYLEIQRMRFNSRFDYELVMPSDHDSGQILVPPLLAQPFVENSIEHGFRNLMKSGKIKIHCSIENDKLGFTIEDNGEGIKHTLKKAKHESKALKIFMERIHVLGKKMKLQVPYTIQDLKELGQTQGTRVKYALPLNLK